MRCAAILLLFGMLTVPAYGQQHGLLLSHAQAEAAQLSGPAQRSPTATLVWLPEALPAAALSSLPASFASGPSGPAALRQALPLAGNYYTLQGIQQQRDLLFWHVPLWTVVINLFAALILFLVWLKQRDIPLFKWLLATCISGNAYLAPHLVSSLDPIVAHGLIALWLYLLTRILYQRPRPAMARLLYALFGSAMLLHAISIASGAFATHLVTGGYFLCLLLLSAERLTAALRRGPDANVALLLAALLLGLAGVLEALMRSLSLHLPGHPGLILPLMPYAQVTAVLAALFFLVARNTANQQELEELNASLERRVHLASEELEQRYAALTRDSVDAAAVHERLVIYRSIHEDLSDKLLQLVYSADSPQAADLARTALDELRDSHRLDPDHPQRLCDVIADIGSEIQVRCEQAGIRLHWSAETTGQEALNSRQCSALSRTLREALSNLLKHARASTVKIEFMLRGSLLVYSVADDGAGMPEHLQPGRGLVNMRNRIQELGGSLLITGNSPSGTRLDFTLPLAGRSA